MMEAKDILAGCILSQGGKPIAGEPVSDNVAVNPVTGGPFVQADGLQVVGALKAAYPRCVFTWLSTPVKVAPKPKAKSEGP